MLGRIEAFLAAAEFERGPWLAVAFGTGIAAWFALPRTVEWVGLIGLCLAVGSMALVLLGEDGAFPFLRQAIAGLALAAAAGCGTVWTKSVLAGTPGIARPVVTVVTGRVLAREEQGAQQRVRLVLAMRDPLDPARIIRARINVPTPLDAPAISEGALVRAPVRLMPPAPPMLPGGYDFARAAWFEALAATGTATGQVELLEPGRNREWLGPLRRALSRHIAGALKGSPGGIAAAFASGDRGSIAPADEDAMRDAGLTHLLSVSGLHVSAVIAAMYLIVLRVLSLVPWLALRVRLPLFAAAAAALAGVFYTLLTGSEVPTVRSVLGALLVLAAVALGREPLSLRMLAVAGFLVMLFWPEAVVGPSFQLSFGAVLAIVALHGAGWMRTFAARREEPGWQATMRGGAVLLLTGAVIELALLPIGLYHFHRAGLYGALANVIAIPLTTFVIMPLVALALMADVVGAGAPVWWLAGQSLNVLLGTAHIVARQPGAVTLLPPMGGWAYVLFLAGGLWLALWSGRVRLWGVLPIVVGTLWLGTMRPPDVLISGDGRQVAFTAIVPGRLVMLRDTRSDFARQRMAEMAAVDETRLVPLDEISGGRCNDEFCAAEFRSGERDWRFLLSRGTAPSPVRDVAAACERVDVVVSDHWLPQGCRPVWLRADRRTLARTGGMALDLATRHVSTVAETQGDQGWWRPQTAERTPHPQ